jgi:cysteinyl-tRNA synthetase
MKYLGKTIDIHGGGLENQFPHHECEIAQSEAANGVQFVRYWLHNNMITVDGKKMGKSLDNFITLKQVFSGAHERLTRSYDPLAVRQLVLNSHYRSPLDFSDAALFAAQSGYEKITETVKAVRKAMAAAGEGEADKEVTKEIEQLKEKFEAAMDDDLNTSIALSVVFELVRLANGLIEEATATKGTLDAVDDLFRKLGGDCLGIVKEEYPQTIWDFELTKEEILEKVVEDFIRERAEAREKKDFAKADIIRDVLDIIGVVLEDRPEGTRWRMK